MNPIYAPAFRSGMLSVMSKGSDGAARWREILRKQRASGLSVAAFCRRSRIAQASFYAWRRRLRNAASFTEVCITSDSDLMGGRLPVRSALELVLPDGRRIAVRPGFDRATLLALVDALEDGTSQKGMADVGVLECVNAKRESGT